MNVVSGRAHALDAYGPFYRVARAHGHDEAKLALESGVVVGHRARYANATVASAWCGELPEARQGFEFWTLRPPDQQHGGIARWTLSDDDELAALDVLVTRVEPVEDLLASPVAAFRSEGAEANVEAVVPPAGQDEFSLNDKFTFEAYVLAVAGAGAVAGSDLITAHHLPGAMIGGIAGGAVGWIRVRMAQRRQR